MRIFGVEKKLLLLGASIVSHIQLTNVSESVSIHNTSSFFEWQAHVKHWTKQFYGI